MASNSISEAELPKNTKRLYIAGPITLGCLAENIRTAIKAADRAVELGWEPYIPHLNEMWNSHFQHTHAFWMDRDFAWLDLCHAVLRLPGESAGADMETKRAKAAGIPVLSQLISPREVFQP